MFKSLLFWLAGEVSWLATLSMSKIKVKISETKYRSFYKTLVGVLSATLVWLHCKLGKSDFVVVNSHVLGCSVFEVFLVLLSKLLSEHAQHSYSEQNTSLESNTKNTESQNK